MIRLDNYVFPAWTLVVGQMITGSIMLGLIGWAIYTVVDALFFHPRVVILFNEKRMDFIYI